MVTRSQSRRYGSDDGPQFEERVVQINRVAKKSMIKVPLAGRTIPHPIEVKFGAARVMMRPAAPGTGIIAGAGVRAVVEAAGIHDILAKSLGSNNPVNVTRAAMSALAQLETPESVAARRQQPVERFRRRKESDE